MRAFVIDHYAHPSAQKLTENAPGPDSAKLGKDEVLVDVYSAALNFFDVCVTMFSDMKSNEPNLILDSSSARQIPESASIPCMCSSPLVFLP
jgi:NADPH2:quinone reductase